MRHLDFRVRGGRGGAQLGVAVGARDPDAADDAREVFIRCAGAQRGAQIVTGAGEEACVEPALGGDARACAVAADGLGDGRDDADLAVSAIATAAARSASSRRSHSPSAATAPAPASPPKAASTHASSRVKATICAPRCAPAHRMKTSRKSSAASGSRAPTATPSCAPPRPPRTRKSRWRTSGGKSSRSARQRANKSRHPELAKDLQSFVCFSALP